MHWVVYNGQHRALDFLLEKGADWRITDAEGPWPSLQGAHVH
jgi:hypothetical protein